MLGMASLFVATASPTPLGKIIGVVFAWLFCAVIVGAEIALIIAEKRDGVAPVENATFYIGVLAVVSFLAMLAFSEDVSSDIKKMTGQKQES